MKHEREDPTEIEGIQALFRSLEPRKMAGEVSAGMLLDIGFDDGVSPVLAVPDNPSQTGRGRARPGCSTREGPYACMSGLSCVMDWVQA